MAAVEQPHGTQRRRGGRERAETMAHGDNIGGDGPESVAESLGHITTDRIRGRVKRAKVIIDASSFDGCPVQNMRQAWEAILEVLEILAAVVITLADTKRTPRPQSAIDWAWALLDRSPLALSVAFLGVCILRATGHTIADVFAATPTP